ncbi:MAG: CDP-alcohol phosphatidyltransferase family protein [Candidatus Cloacimonadota bacterium]|nr:CDP-alcohol phosphatidyltransferase family protein [Candidatus Cloacimonadota bacterium]
MYSKNSEYEKINYDSDDILTLPNILTFIRLIILPFILIYFTKGHNWVAFWLLILAGITDIADGYLARRMNQTTPFGRILDPVVDKIFFLMIIVFLMFYSDFPLWAFISIIFLEFLILLGSYILMKNYRLVPSSNIFGKIAVTFLSLAVYMYILNIGFFNQTIFANISLQYLTLIIGILLLFNATVIYAKSVVDVIKKIKNQEK